MPRQWTAQELSSLAREFQPACLLLAGAELDVFGTLAAGAMTAGQLAERLQTDPPATAVLLDALAATGLLVKEAGRYGLAGGVGDVLAAGAETSRLPMMRHLANCLRSWAQLARVVKTGRPADCPPSVRGEAADLEAFVEAMGVASRAAAPEVVSDIGPPAFRHLLDVGAGPGTWTIAFLRAAPDATATLYDVPGAMPVARRHLAEAGLLDRVDLVAGDFYADEALPAGADLAWVSAIVHQNTRPQNRELFAKVHAALASGGRILLRDVVMDASRTSPAAGAMFAVHMLVRSGGGTFTFEELRADLLAAGFTDPKLLRRNAGMSSVVQATRP